MKSFEFGDASSPFGPLTLTLSPEDGGEGTRVEVNPLLFRLQQQLGLQHKRPRGGDPVSGG